MKGKQHDANEPGDVRNVRATLIDGWVRERGHYYHWELDGVRGALS